MDFSSSRALELKSRRPGSSTAYPFVPGCSPLEMALGSGQSGRLMPTSVRNYATKCTSYILHLRDLVIKHMSCTHVHFRAWLR